MMKMYLFALAITCVPLMLEAAEKTETDSSVNPWVFNKVLYSDENCGEPVAYLDARGNILPSIDLADQAPIGTAKR